MDVVEDRLTAIGYRRSRPEPECWRVTQIGAAVPLAPSPRRDPATSRALARWLERLAGRGPEAPYQIRLMQPVSGAACPSRRR